MDHSWELRIAPTGSRGAAVDYIGTGEADASAPTCNVCGKGMAEIFRSFVGGQWVLLHRCSACAPMSLAEPGSRLSRMPDPPPLPAAARGLIRVPLEPSAVEAFCSRIGGPPLLMDDDASLPWPDGGHDCRARRHLLSIVDMPEAGFDPTGYPIVVFEGDDDGQLTWVGDGR